MLRVNSIRAKEAINALWVAFAFQFILIFGDIYQLSIIREIEAVAQAGGNVYELQEKADTSDTINTIVAIINAVIAIITGILFIRWFRRAYYNLHLIKNPLNYTEGWAAVGWFIPIMSFFIPFSIMKELFNQTRLFFILKNRKIDNLSDNILPIWWSLFILGSVIHYIAFRISLSANDIDDFYNIGIASVIAEAIKIFAAYFAILIVKKYADAERVLYEITLPITDSKNISETSKVITQ
nr:DUF4328 domain-containing protein [uncultured Capnocytophaga sp.]